MQEDQGIKKNEDPTASQEAVLGGLEIWLSYIGDRTSATVGLSASFVGTTIFRYRQG